MNRCGHGLIFNCHCQAPDVHERSSQCRALKVRHMCSVDEEADEWTLQSGFDGDELLARPRIELVIVDSTIARKAERQIESCEHCHPADAEIPFEWILTNLTGKRGPYDFMLSEMSLSEW